MTRIYAGRSGVQILAEATEISLLQNIQTSSGAHPYKIKRMFDFYE